MHREAADSRHLGLTPPQGPYASSSRYPDINVRGPGGLTPLHVAVCRSTDFRDSYHDDDKDSEDSAEGSVVCSLVFVPGCLFPKPFCGLKICSVNCYF